MKYLRFTLLLGICNVLHAQNIQALYEQLPPFYATCDEAFKSAELEWVEERLFNDSLFNRVKSWAPGGPMKEFGTQLDKMQAYIERSSENNSFALNAPPEINKETMASLDHLSQLQKSIRKQWDVNSSSITNSNTEFVVPNELDNSCEQIQAAMKNLQKVSADLDKSYRIFYQSIQSTLSSFQEKFSELAKIKHPMVNNQCLDELSSLLNILFEINNTLNFHYKNMVETRMAWNNALCK